MSDHRAPGREYTERQALDLFLSQLRETDPSPEVLKIIDQLEDEADKADEAENLGRHSRAIST